MIVIATIGATMTMPIAPRLPVLSAMIAEPAMTRTQTSEPAINHAVDDPDVVGATTTRSKGRLRSSSTLFPIRRSVPSFILISRRTRSHSPRCQ